ncbi:hypothetical protein PSF70_17140 [Methanosarcina mazei]|nr:hypothetical protein PSF70_17095 [Methanosarcina mazei]WIM43159.1 hypothetical protein PSF70_17140 [Methanosarcina mazei]
MELKYCCVCGSRRQRNLILFEDYRTGADLSYIEWLKTTKKSHMCIRCYIYYLLVVPGLLPGNVPYRTYEEVKASDWSPDYRYGAYFNPKIEKMLINAFRENFSMKPFKERDLWAFLDKKYREMQINSKKECG